MNSFCVFWYLYSISLNSCMHIYRDKFRIYINTLLAFNENCVGELGGASGRVNDLFLVTDLFLGLVERYVIHLEGLGDHGQGKEGLKWK